MIEKLTANVSVSTSIDPSNREEKEVDIKLLWKTIKNITSSFVSTRSELKVLKEQYEENEKFIQFLKNKLHLSDFNDLKAKMIEISSSNNNSKSIQEESKDVEEAN